MTTARDLMKQPIAVDRNSTVSEALRKLVNEDISRVLVSHDGEPVGVLTERDIGLFLLTEQTERKIDEIPVTEIMNPLVTVNNSVSVEDCAQIMVDRDIGSLGVNFNGKTQGRSEEHTSELQSH